jgi:hypothetical protein
MITNLLRDGWQVIYHRAHALLAAQLAGHWRRSDAPERLYETIAAISHHDDLEREWEGNELTPSGAPLDFTLGESSDSPIAPLEKHITEALYRSRWVAFLTSKHTCFLSQDKWGTSPEWDTFLQNQQRQQETWRQALEIEAEAAERAYQFMQWCDRLSLILAQNQLPEAGRALEITSGIDGQRYDIRQLETGEVTVEPWPFENSEFTVNVESCHLSELKFADNEVLVKALHQAPIEVLEWTFAKPK